MISIRLSLRLAFLAVVPAALPVWSQPGQREPSLGYLYPAGAGRGTTVEVIAGGQSLFGTHAVFVSGEGVEARVVKVYRGFRRLNGNQRRVLVAKLKELRTARLAELRGEPPPAKPVAPKPLADDTGNKRPTPLPEHPLLRDLEHKNLKQLAYIAYEFLDVRKRQPNAQLAEMVLLEVTVDPDAPVGDREFRLVTRRGLTNPRCFQVGVLPEINEQEPNAPLDFVLHPTLKKEPPLTPPFTYNGQIEPGDVDRFSFRATEGRKLVVNVKARHLVPFLADAVPGWFQATVTLYDDTGKEVAFADDFRFDPDPVLLFRVPQTGVYEVEIRDAIYRGRRDFVYRVSISEQPFVTSLFPLTAQQGTRATARVGGWNLPQQQVPLDTRPDGPSIRELRLVKDETPSNPVRYAVTTLPNLLEAEPNDTRNQAQPVTLPNVINGRIQEPGDIDLFAFAGKAGEQVVLDVRARRLLSPLDSVVRLLDASGAVVAWNDDHMIREKYLHPDMGVLTHHADSYLLATLPGTGTYYAQVGDVQQHGGGAYTYSLRLSPAQPDFEVRAAPATLNMRPGMAAPVWLYALRKDGFTGEIQLRLVDAPPGFRLDGGRIPAGHERVCATLTAPRGSPSDVVPLRLEATAPLHENPTTHAVIPCENRMQAFLWRHLVPTTSLLANVPGGRRRGPTLSLLSNTPVKISTTGITSVKLQATRLPTVIQRLELDFKQPREGLALQETVAAPGSLTLKLRTEGDALKPGYQDNLVVEAFAHVPWGKRDAKGNRGTRRVSLGMLPAIPFEIVTE